MRFLLQVGKKISTHKAIPSIVWFGRKEEIAPPTLRDIVSKIGISNGIIRAVEDFSRQVVLYKEGGIYPQTAVLVQKACTDNVRKMGGLDDSVFVFLYDMLWHIAIVLEVCLRNYDDRMPGCMLPQ